MRVAENYARNDTHKYTPGLYDNLHRTTVSDDLLGKASVGDVVYVSLLLDVRELLPRLRVHDRNRSKSLSIGDKDLIDIPPGIAWHTLTYTLMEGADRTDWVLDVWDCTEGTGKGKDMDLLQVIVSLSPSDIWTPAHADLTAEQIATLPPYGEYKEIKTF